MELERERRVGDFALGWPRINKSHVARKEISTKDLSRRSCGWWHLIEVDM